MISYLILRRLKHSIPFQACNTMKNFTVCIHSMAVFWSCYAQVLMSNIIFRHRRALAHNQCWRADPIGSCLFGRLWKRRVGKSSRYQWRCQLWCYDFSDIFFPWPTFYDLQRLLDRHCAVSAQPDSGSRLPRYQDSFWRGWKSCWGCAISNEGKWSHLFCQSRKRGCIVCWSNPVSSGMTVYDLCR